MAELDTLPTEIDPERLRRLALLSQVGPVPSPALAPIQPASPSEISRVHDPARHSDLAIAESVDRSRPRIASVSGEPEAPSIGSPAASSGLQPIGTPSPVKALSFAERQALPMISPGAPAGSAASTQSELERLKDKGRNPWGSAENHPGFLGKVGHVAAKIGNIAGDIVAPGTMALIPGTELNRKVQEQGLERNLGQQQERESVEVARKSTQSLGERAQTLAEKKEAFEEGKEPKPPAIDEQAVAAKMKEIDPKTQKPYTAFDARLALAQGIEDTKPEKAAGEPKTVTMLDKEGGKPYLYQHDPKGNYSGNEGFGQWKKIGPAQPNATTLGIVGTMQPLLNPDGSFSGKTFNNKTGKVGDTDTSNLEGATTSSGARLANTQRNQFNTQYVKPSTDIEQNYRKFQGAYNEYQNNPATGAASMVALAQHLGSTFGSIKGTTQGEHMISEHKDAIGLLDKIGRY